jgi:glycerol 2-dehydrogenase (NADP+)
VGEGLQEALSTGVKREDVFITTKLWCTYHSRVEENLDLSLKSLGVDYVDLYLMHWPCPMNPKGNIEEIRIYVNSAKVNL